jgi:hypothetical protein
MGHYHAKMRRLLPIILAALLLSLAAGGIARAEDDYDRARRALLAGEIRPFGQIAGLIQWRCRARVIAVTLEDRGPPGGRRFWIYQLRMIRGNGDVLLLDVNAATAQILRIWGRAPMTCR